MIQMNYNLFLSTAKSFKKFHKINRNALAIVNDGFIERDGVFVLRSYLHRLNSADKKFSVDETGIEMFVNDISISEHTEAYRTAQLYIVTDCLIEG
jgi:hypothetical protein